MKFLEIHFVYFKNFAIEIISRETHQDSKQTKWITIFKEARTIINFPKYTI